MPPESEGHLRRCLENGRERMPRLAGHAAGLVAGFLISSRIWQCSFFQTHSEGVLIYSCLISLNKLGATKRSCSSASELVKQILILPIEFKERKLVRGVYGITNECSRWRHPHLRSPAYFRDLALSKGLKIWHIETKGTDNPKGSAPFTIRL
jgi:hypothetical protein